MSVRTPAWAVYDIFDTADAEQVFVAVVTETQWGPFCAAFGLSDLAADPSLATQPQRVAGRERTIPRIAAVLRTLTRAQLIERCEALGCAYAPIGKPADLFDDPHLSASDGLVPTRLPDGRSTRLPALPLALDGARPPPRRDPPAVGEQGAEIARELGYDDDAITGMRAAGVLV